jgi:hypothetical protein
VDLNLFYKIHSTLVCRFPAPECPVMHTGKKVSNHWEREHPGERFPLLMEDFYQLVPLPDPLYVDTNRVVRLLAAKGRRAQIVSADDPAQEFVSAQENEAAMAADSTPANNTPAR